MLTDETARALPLAERRALRDHWLTFMLHLHPQDRQHVVASSDERALLDECTGGRGCPAELHLVGCPERRKPPPPRAPVQLPPSRRDIDMHWRRLWDDPNYPAGPRGLPDPTNLEHRGSVWVRRVGLLWLGLFIGALLPVGPWLITLCACVIALLLVATAWPRRAKGA